jgi:hypothetical protein
VSREIRGQGDGSQARHETRAAVNAEAS